MHRPDRLVALLSSLLLCACAGPQPQQVAVPQGEPSNVQLYLQAVEDNAASRSVDVYWINPPDDEDLDEHSADDLDARDGDS